MRKIVLVLSLSGGLWQPAAASAQEICAATTQEKLVECARWAAGVAEEELQSALSRYRQAVAGTSRGELLNQAQSAWESFRYAHCRFMGAKYADELLEAAEIATCQSILTKERADQLLQKVQFDHFRKDPIGSQSRANGT